MADFRIAHDETMGNEGGSSFNPNDKGNVVVNGVVTVPTYKGIAPVSHGTWRGFEIIKQTIATLNKMPPWGTEAQRNWRKHLDATLAANATLQGYVLSFYEAGFWTANRLGKIIDQRAANWIYDHVVNGGARGVMWAQAAARVTVDGGMGPKSLAAINAMDPREFLQRAADIAGAFRVDRMGDNTSQVQFGVSWLERDGQPATVIAAFRKAAADGKLDDRESAALKNLMEMTA